MRRKRSRAEGEDGFILMVVMLLTAASALLAFGLMDQGSGQMLIASRQENMEAASSVAEGGCALCLSYIMDGNAVPASLTGSIGGGTYYARINFGGGAANQNYTLCATGFVGVETTTVKL